MRILCVDNGAIVAKGSARLVNRPSARFYLELAERLPGVTLAQALFAGVETDTLGNYDLAGAPGLRIAGLPWRGGSAAARALNYARALPFTLRRVLEADALYLYAPGRLPSLFARAARLLGRPYGVYLRGEPSAREDRALLAGARFVIVANEGMRREAERHCRDVALVRPMIDFTPDDVVRGRKARRTPPWRVLFVGRIEARKGVGELIEAMGMLRRRGLSFALRLVGGSTDGAELEALRARAAAEGLEPGVFYGVAREREALADCYRWADVLVLPTHTEGFARVLWEAMVFGVPALTTFVGGIPSVLTDEVNAIRLPVRDPAGLADRIARALEDPDRRERIAAAGAELLLETLVSRRWSHVELAERKLRELAARG
jgi:glycosyltransferase involved in cell wall biosynthesis